MNFCGAQTKNVLTLSHNCQWLTNGSPIQKAYIFAVWVALNHSLQGWEWFYLESVSARVTIFITL